MFDELSRYCLQQWGPTVALWKANCTLGKRMNCLGIPMGLNWPIIHLYATQSHYQKLHLAQYWLCLIDY